MTINLTGNHEINKINLTGKCASNIASPSYKINQLKIYILTNFIIPLYSEQWDVIHNNKIFIDETIKRVCEYYNKYKLDELNMFSEILKVLKILISKNYLLSNLERKMANYYDKNNIINMVYKTTRIQILPEYELYNSIIGKPTKNNPYDERIIQDIKIQILKTNATFDKIKHFIHQKYIQVLN